MVHAARQPGAVIDKMELAAERLRVGRPAWPPRSVNMPRIQDRNWSAACSTSPPGGASVEAAMNAQPLNSGCLYCWAWASKTARIFWRGSSNRSIASVSLLVVRSCRRGQIGGHQLFLAPEEVVERGFGDPGALDDAVDADGLDALGVEEFVGRSQEALPWPRPEAQSGAGCGAHGRVSFQTGLSMCLRRVRSGWR